MECLVEPYYYNNNGNYGLAVEITGNSAYGDYISDEIRAFVVMTFPYIFPQTETEPSETEEVSQAFYRSSGYNSQAQFGDNISDAQARGTWIPTNGLVMKSGYFDSTGVCVLNSPFILKKPFINLELNNLLVRFHGDPQLALVSYKMGGGIWNVKAKRMELANLLYSKGLNDYANYVMNNEPGCVGLTNNTVPALPKDINEYIADSVSWNWHPLDISFLNQSGLTDGIDLNNKDIWIEKDGRYFIPENIFYNPGLLKNYYRYVKMFGPEKASNIALGQIYRGYDRCPWAKNTDPIIYKK